ncbi:MAG: hypothetical protein FWC84_03640, partial [Alphaproteobacteria bacterium]|nr:hypothetical protein [Alphaproteobacteria bacterium]
DGSSNHKPWDGAVASVDSPHEHQIKASESGGTPAQNPLPPLAYPAPSSRTRTLRWQINQERRDGLGRAVTALCLPEDGGRKQASWPHRRVTQYLATSGAEA